MIKTYLNTFFRKFKKEKLFSFLNLGGLTVGLTTVLLIGLYIVDELSFDKFHSRSEEIYLLYQQTGKGKSSSDRVPYSLANKMLEDLPEIDKTVSITNRDLMVSSGEQVLLDNNVSYVTPDFFDVFDFPLIYGEASKISDPSSIFLTKSVAEKFFGEATLAMAKTVIIDEGEEYQIAGVLADPPANSTIQFEFIVPGKQLFSDRSARNDGPNGYFPTQNWVILKEGTERDALLPKMEAIMRSMPYGDIYEYTEEAQNIFLLPFEQFHLEAGLDYSNSKRSDIRYIYLFSAIGFLVLLIAIINYTNLSTAQSIKRAKEVGLRKVIGASRDQVILYYLLESFALVLFSAILAFAITERMLPWVNGLLDKAMSLDYFTYEFFLIIFGSTLVIGLLSGLYPAFVLSSAKPLQALTDHKKRSKNQFRKVLIVTQFFIAQLLIIATVIIQQQLHYIQNKNLGYDREHLIEIALHDKVGDDPSQFKNQLNTIAGVESVSLSRSTLQRQDIWFMDDNDLGTSDNREVIIDFFGTDADFPSTLGIEMVSGESLQQGKPGVIISESAFKAFGWDSYNERSIKVGQESLPVLGVFADFHNESFKSDIRPGMITLESSKPNFALVRLAPSAIASTLSAVEDLWNGLETGRPLDYKFLDQAYEAQYQAEMRLGEMFLFFSGLAIFIAILGIVGLSTFTIEQRIKEISLRRVLGANYREIFQLFAKSYVGMIFLGFIIAAPIVYYFTKDWLSQFVYRIEPGVISFSSALLVTLMISLSVIVLQIGKTKRINPAETLRNE